MTKSLDSLTPRRINPAWFKPKLTLDHVAALLSQNYTQAECARLLCVSKQAVNQFISYHQDALLPLIDASDMALSLRCKSKAIEILNSIDEVDVKKASLLQKTTSMGILIDKHRLLQSQSAVDNGKDIVIHIHNALFTHAPTNIKSIDTIDVKVEPPSLP